MDELGIASVGKLPAHVEERFLPGLHHRRVSRDQGDDDDGFDQRAENGAGVGTRPPAHFSDANHTEHERERHEQRSDFVCSGVKIIEHGAKMKTAILVVLLVILVVLGGIYWNQVRERDERLKREAAAEAARQKSKPKSRSPDSARRKPPCKPLRLKRNSIRS